MQQVTRKPFLIVKAQMLVNSEMGPQRKGQPNSGNIVCTKKSGFDSYTPDPAIPNY